MKRLAIVTTHPIQYNAPLFKLIHERKNIAIKVFYTWEQSSEGAKYDPGFRKKIEWDIPLLEGYDYKFVKNISSDPGTHHFTGIINPTLNSEILEWKPDAVMIFGWSFKSHLKCLRYFKGKIPVLFRGDSTLLDEQPGIKKWMRRLFLTWVYKKVDYALYAGINNKNYFLKHGLKEHQLVFAPHSVDNVRFAHPSQTYAEKAAAWKEELGIAESDFVILFAGKLEPKKNPFFILQLASVLKEKKMKFIFVGNGVLEEALKNSAESDKRIYFLDFQNQYKMPVVYRLCDVFILPSKGPGETWGLSVNEAMACGKPVLVSRHCGCAADLVLNGKTGYDFSETDKNDLAVKIISMTDPDKLRKMKKESEDLIKRFSFESTAEAIEKTTEFSR